MNAKRVIVAIILITLAIGAFISGGILLAVFMGVFMFVGLRELVDIARAKGMNPPLRYIAFVNLLLLSLTTFKFYEGLFPVFSTSAILAFLIILFRGTDARINDVSMTLLGLIYSGVFPVHIMMLRNMDMGYVLLLLLVVAACDVAAYYSGMLFGKHLLWKEVSPKKTIEGSVGGTLAGILIAVIIGHFIELSLIHSIFSGLIIAVVGQLGDLSESMLKRDVGIKDSGTVLPGHGGVLDRTDSYIFTGVVAYYYFKYLVIG